MYEEFYGLKELPFELTANPKFLLLTGKHREALSNLLYGITARKGITLLVGEAGTGKTTLVRTAFRSAESNADCLYLHNPALKRSEFLEFIASGLGLRNAAKVTKTALLSHLEGTLTAKLGEGRVTALVVDEAQSLPDELLEEIRLLANVETDTQKLLPVVLVGQPELADRLNEPSLRQLKQRVSLRCELPPLSLQETAMYIASRIRTAGGNCARLFTREAVQAIHQRARGIPRTISVICDNALVTGFAANRRPVGEDIVLEVCRDFDLAQGGPRARRSADGKDPDDGEEPLVRRESREAPEGETGRSPGVPDVTAAPVESNDPALFGTVGRRRRFSFFGR